MWSGRRGVGEDVEISKSENSWNGEFKLIEYEGTKMEEHIEQTEGKGRSFESEQKERK